MATLRTSDPAVAAAIAGEKKRQKNGLELIASENYVSDAVLEALGSVMTNKYAEGYPGKRYYGGQAFTDAVEQIAIDRARALFGAQHANVQPHSGAPANMIVYSALLSPGDTVLGMDLGHGGHLTHGHPVTLSAKLYNFVRYTTEEDGTIDYDKLRALARLHRPKMILAGFSAYSRSLRYGAFRAIADDVGAILMMDMAHIAGLVAAKVVPNPVRVCDVVTTTTHKTLRGPRGGMILCKKRYAAAIDKATFPGFQGGPHMNTIAAKAVALGEAMTPRFRAYAARVLANAKVMERELKKRGFRICFGTTENHLLLIDMVTSKGMTGKHTEEILESVGITLNKNMIPDDPRSPRDPSGIRLGVAAVTTRGMRERDMVKIAEWIDAACAARDDAAARCAIRAEVAALCKKFPLHA